MNIALWIAQVLLAAVFLMAGVVHAFYPAVALKTGRCEDVYPFK